jgi:ribosome-associated toxin RatA of RatAB toxin-antitoxin module
MPVVESSIEIAAPRTDLFRLSQDYALRTDWDPFVRSMHFLDGAEEAGLGVGVHVHAHNGLHMEVVFITFRPPELAAMKMTSGPFFFSNFAGTWRFAELGAARTRVTFRYNFAIRYRWLKPIVEPLIARSFRRDIEGRLAGMKRAAEETDILERLGRRQS